jgi:cytochrome c oxidase subunit 2
MQSWIPFIPDQASTVSGKVDALYFYLVGVTIFFTLLITSVITFFVIRYRRRSQFEVPRPVAGSLKLETLWTVIPFIIAMSIFVWGANLYFIQYRAPKEAMEVFVVGKQWMWKIQHSTGQREINELHVPVGTRVKLTMTTEDVIHDFYVPAFRTKADVIPGRYTTIWFEATKTGRFHLFCAEYCGTDHSRMIGSVIVMERTDFDNWLAGNVSQLSPAEAGAKLFQSLSCNTCHASDGAEGRGPSLAGLFGKQVELSGGQRVTADDAYLRESILNPGAKVVAGYQAIMPPYQGQVNEEQVLQLIAYIKSLQPAQPAGSAGASGAPDSGAPPAGTSGARPAAAAAPRGHQP